MASLGNVIAELRIEDRGWTVLHHRYGLGTQRTLEYVGKALGLTRERIRQIEKKARIHLWNGTLVLLNVNNALEKDHLRLGEPFRSDVSRRSVLGRLNRVLARIDLPGTVSDRYRLIVAVRAAQEMYASKWPNLTYLFCSLPPSMLAHPSVRAAVAAQAEAKRQWSYPELARRVLEQEGAPMHWHDALDAAERLNRRKYISPGGFFNTLCDIKHVFVRVGPGTYGLVKWGLQERRTNVDLVAEYLANQRQTRSFGEILHGVGIPSKIKQNSLQMSLDLNPRFYKSIEGKYGLRGWLPPREKQTLRSAPWKVEAPDSHVRVERALDRGYDIEAICSRDALLES